MSQRSELMKIAIEKSRLADRDKQLREELQNEIAQLLVYVELADRAYSFAQGLFRGSRKRKPVERRSFLDRILGRERERVPVR